ncbi:MAG: 4Fe-4S binding protein [Candidatus Magnetomorum sp.]|nr:4Fe-4S binding protein [Candidatus Magnetomorum sp.]
MSYTIKDACIGCEVCKRLCPVDAIYGEKENVQKIDEDLCIDCGACGKICPKGAIYDDFGVQCEIVKRSKWDRPKFDVSKCTSCLSCVDICPVKCLLIPDIEETNQDRLIPFISEINTCIGCGFCELKCPVEAIIMVSS